jgi:hypothetical protein
MGGYRMSVVREMGKRRAVLNMTMNFRFPNNAGNVSDFFQNLLASQQGLKFYGYDMH